MSVKQRLAGWQLPALSPQTRSPSEANRVVLKRLGPRILRGIGCRQISRLLLVDELAAQAERIDDVIMTPIRKCEQLGLEIAQVMARALERTSPRSSIPSSDRRRAHSLVVSHRKLFATAASLPLSHARSKVREGGM